jgi:hypothetical protein
MNIRPKPPVLIREPSRIVKTNSKIPIKEKIAVLSMNILEVIHQTDVRWNTQRQYGAGKTVDGLQNIVLRRTAFLFDILREYDNRKDIASIVNSTVKNLEPVVANIVNALIPTDY